MWMTMSNMPWQLSFLCPSQTKRSSVCSLYGVELYKSPDFVTIFVNVSSSLYVQDGCSPSAATLSHRSVNKKGRVEQ